MKRIFIFAMFAGTAVLANAQGASLADLQQDFALMRREVGQLRLEVEQLRNENSKLAEALKKAQSSSTNADSMNAVASSLRTEMTSKDETVKREVLAQIKREMESMAAQTNASLKKLADAIGSRPQAPLPTNFSSNYPQTGVSHTVASGDTLSGIARQYGSKTKWIQDANKIADPARDLTVGRQIFIPKE